MAAPYGRDGVIPTATITFRVVFTDDVGCLVDPDAVPNVYIYDESVTEATIITEVAADTFTSALSGPFVSTKITTGFYEYAYTVPSASAEGTWHDVWEADLDSVQSNQYFAFTVEVGAVLTEQTLRPNEIVVVDLAATIADTEATPNTLAAATALSFGTTYNPFHASPTLVRMEIGPWIDFIPDDTLAMMIHWSSKEAAAIATAAQRGSLFKLARTKLVIYDAALRALMLPGANSAQASGAARKQLGDLLIDQKQTATGVPVLSSGVDLETITSIRNARDEWWRVVNAGGSIVPGQSFDPTYAIKGYNDPDRRAIGRLWDSPEDHAYGQPSANTKGIHRGRNRATFRFTRNRRGGK